MTLLRLFAAGALMLAHNVAATDIYVSPEGSDAAGDGSQAHPVATLLKAQTLARKAMAFHGGTTENVTVHLGPGLYYQRDALAFTGLDSGRGGRRMR
jgi:aspartate carbamoyltransferase catalytic subunit